MRMGMGVGGAVASIRRRKRLEEEAAALYGGGRKLEQEPLDMKTVCFCIILLVIVSLLAAALGLGEEPAPIIAPIISVTTATMSSSNLYAHRRLSAEFDLTFSIQNKKPRGGIVYKKATLSVLYGRKPLATIDASSFFDDKVTTTRVKIRIDPDDYKRIKKRSVIPFSFEITALGEPHPPLRLRCADIGFWLENGTTARGATPKRCKPRRR